MPDPSLFPKFMNPLGGGAGGGGDGLIVELMADPTIVLDDSGVSVTVQTDTINVEVDPEISIEVE